MAISAFLCKGIKQNGKRSSIAKRAVCDTVLGVTIIVA